MTQAAEHKPNEAAQFTPLRCPVCATPLKVGLLKITEDDGVSSMLLTFDCPMKDYHGTLTAAAASEMVALGVFNSLMQDQPGEGYVH